MTYPVTLTDTASPVLAWADEADIEPQALQQLRDVSELPGLYGLRVMPDVHFGKGATVGSVIAMEQALAPAAVGVDIGCGVNAVRTSLFLDDLSAADLRKLRSRFEAVVPAGFAAHTSQRDARDVLRGTPSYSAALRTLSASTGLRAEVSDREFTRAFDSMGTLGGGNHFIELCTDSSKRVWITLHSGSRGIGNQLAQRHMAIARDLPANADLPDHLRELSLFYKGTPEMEAYLHDLRWAQAYAMHSRTIMMELVKRELAEHFAEVYRVTAAAQSSVTFDDEINCLAGETLVRTRSGYKPIAELAGADHELLTSGGIWVTAPVMSFGKQRLYELEVRRFGEVRTLRATANHRWLLRPTTSRSRSEAVTADLRPGDFLAYVAPRRPDGLTADRAAVARGFVFGDGTARKNRSSAYFCGDKDKHLMTFFDGLSPNGFTRPPSMPGVTVLNGLPVEWKREIPATSADPSFLYGWVAGYFAADGDVDASGRPTLSSATRENLEAVAEICDAIGIRTHPIRERVTGRNSYKPGSRSFLMGFVRSDLSEDFFPIPAHRDRWFGGKDAVVRVGWTVSAVRPTDAIETVFCATVPETHAFALADGILTGNCHHNYVAEEVIDGRDMIVTRKGAISAKSGELALIPGSMATGSYIVRGLGNPASFQSASHGAGRRMSRNKAKKTFTVADVERTMAGIEARTDEGVIDEISLAYKDLDSVIAAESDLVEVVEKLDTILCVKG